MNWSECHRRPTLYWNEKLVQAHLMHAAAIHRRLPEPRVLGYHSLWPETLKDDWERLYDLLNGAPRLGPPMPPEVSYHECVMEWLRRLDRSWQQLLWLRANKIPWKEVEAQLGRSVASLQRDQAKALYQLALHLNRVDPKGEHLKTLQNRALLSVSRI